MSLTLIDYLVATNEDWRDALQITSGEGEDTTPVDITGSVFRAQFREVPERLFVSMEASTLNGRLVIDDAAAGSLSWNVPSAVLELMEPRAYAYDLVWTSAEGVTDTIVSGSLTIKRGITR